MSVPKKRVVRRTVREHIYRLLVADIEGEKTFEYTWRDGGGYPRRDQTVMNAANKELGDGYKVLKILAHEYEPHVYEMDERFYLEHATQIM